jgi:hypothetical protein
MASGATGFAAFTITRLGIVGSGGSSAALAGTASANRDSETTGAGATSTGTTTGSTTTGAAATTGTGSTTTTGTAATAGAGSATNTGTAATAGAGSTTTGTAATAGAGSATTTGTGSGSNGGGAVSIARMVSTGIASTDSGTGKAAICFGSDGAKVISNIGSAEGRTVGALVRTATCESTRRRVSVCGSGSMVSRMTTGCARTGVIGGGAVGCPDEHAAKATHVVSVVNGSSVSEYFIECDHRW